MSNYDENIDTLVTEVLAVVTDKMYKQDVPIQKSAIHTEITEFLDEAFSTIKLDDIFANTDKPELTPQELTLESTTNNRTILTLELQLQNDMLRYEKSMADHYTVEQKTKEIQSIIEKNQGPLFK